MAIAKRENMQPQVPDPETMLPLSPAVFHILLALADGDRHGYSIMQEIAAHTEGKLRIGATTLYRSIKHMLTDGLIIEVDEQERPEPGQDDERRRYYRLTNFGQQVAGAEMQRLTRAITVAKSKPLLGGWQSALSGEGTGS